MYTIERPTGCPHFLIKAMATAISVENVVAWGAGRTQNTEGDCANPEQLLSKLSRNDICEELEGLLNP
jgi:hypothetical protein